MPVLMLCYHRFTQVLEDMVLGKDLKLYMNPVMDKNLHLDKRPSAPRTVPGLVAMQAAMETGHLLLKKLVNLEMMMMNMTRAGSAPKAATTLAAMPAVAMTTRRFPTRRTTIMENRSGWTFTTSRLGVQMPRTFSSTRRSARPMLLV